MANKIEDLSLERTIFENNLTRHAVKTDRMFGFLFAFQYFGGIGLAILASPWTWEGAQASLHPHIVAAIVIGALISSFPIYLAWKIPGQYMNRFVVATAQMAYSVLLIHLSGGRIETHFHIFGSLAFIAFYRDFRPVLLATILTAIDHLLRGYLWPESVYGVLQASPWRAIEHSTWVVFEDIVLFYSIRMSQGELWELSRHQSELQQTLAQIELLAAERTKALESSQQTVIDQQQALVLSAKMSALGEMAGGIAHEINTPLAIMHLRVEEIEEMAEHKQMDPLQLFEVTEVLKKTIDRIAKTVKGLRSFARDGKNNPRVNATVESVIDETLSLCRERFKNNGVDLTVEGMETAGEIRVRTVEISQVILNLLNNAFDAIKSLDHKWVKIQVAGKSDHVVVSITDSGNGIPAEIREKIMQPFFTTKQVGEGTGLGLSISKGIVESHQGSLEIDPDSSNTRFVMKLPRQAA